MSIQAKYKTALMILKSVDHNLEAGYKVPKSDVDIAIQKLEDLSKVRTANPKEQELIQKLTSTCQKTIEKMKADLANPELYIFQDNFYQKR